MKGLLIVQRGRREDQWTEYVEQNQFVVLMSTVSLVLLLWGWTRDQVGCGCAKERVYGHFVARRQV